MMPLRSGAPAPRLLRWGFAVALAPLVFGCALPDRVQSSGDLLVEMSCSPLNPLMQTHILEAVVSGGGPTKVDVAGWMCGRRRSGYVRVVMLRYTPESHDQPQFLVPAIFEHESMVGFGWHLMDVQPERYGTQGPERDHPWRAPPGWSCRRHPMPALADRGPSTDP